MQTFAVAFIATSILLVAAKSEVKSPENIENSASSNNTTVHLFVLLVPDSTLKELTKGRQEEVGTGPVDQIIQGVLGGGVRPVFAGSTSILGEPAVQNGVSAILSNVAPSITNILKGWVNRAQIFFRVATTTTTTPSPGPDEAVSVSNQTATSTSAPVVEGRPWQESQPTDVPPQTAQSFLQAQAALIGQELLKIREKYPLEVISERYPSQIIEATNIISGNSGTKVQPLPIINLRPDDEDDELKEKLS